MSDTQRLPKWAQERIKELERQRDEALKALNQWKDDQTASKFSSTFPLCTGEAVGPTFKTVYYHPSADRITVKHDGVELTVSAFRKGEIELKWNCPNHLGDEIAFIPSGYQTASLKSQTYMRK